MSFLKAVRLCLGVKAWKQKRHLPLQYRHSRGVKQANKENSTNVLVSHFHFIISDSSDSLNLFLPLECLPLPPLH